MTNKHMYLLTYLHTDRQTSRLRYNGNSRPRLMLHIAMRPKVMMMTLMNGAIKLLSYLLIGTDCTVCGAWSMKWYGVCPSICVLICLSQHGPTTANLRCCGPDGQEISIDCCNSGGQMRAVPRCQRT